MIVKPSSARPPNRSGWASGAIASANSTKELGQPLSRSKGAGEGPEPGGNPGWGMIMNGKEPFAIDNAVIGGMGFRNPKWDWRTFDMDRDTARADQKAGYMNAMDPDLSAFKARGGKLLMYHGWNDGASGGSISPLNSVNYYSSVLAKMGPEQENWLRLFMVPGMAHCGGGPGPNQFNALAAIEQASDLGGLVSAEAQAASAYWDAWAALPFPFRASNARTDRQLLQMQQQILAHRSAKKKDGLESVDWRKFHDAVKEFLEDE